MQGLIEPSVCLIYGKLVKNGRRTQYSIHFKLKMKGYNNKYN